VNIPNFFQAGGGIFGRKLVCKIPKKINLAKWGGNEEMHPRGILAENFSNF
jgi:hypothetical protein